MNTLKKLSILLAVVAVILFSGVSPVSAQSGDGGSDGHMVVGGVYTLDDGDTLQGDLLVIAGNATLKEGSLVNGNVLIIGGNLAIYGEVNGDILTLGGIVNLYDSAQIDGDLVSFGGIQKQEPGAVIKGNVISNEGDLSGFNPDEFDFNFGEFDQENLNPNNQTFFAPQMNLLKQVGKFTWNVAKVVGVALMAVVASLLFGKPMEKTARTLFTNPAMSFGIGLLTILVAPALLIVLMITLILIPVSLIGLFGMALAVLFGWFSFSLLLGERIAEMFHTEWSAPLNTGIGALTLGIISLISGVVPCIGWLLPFLIACAGLGAVILSKAGSRIYAPASAPTSAQKPTAPAKTAETPADYTLPGVKKEAAPAIEPVEDLLPPLDLDNPGDETGEEKSE